MKERLETRLKELRKEFDFGQKDMMALNNRRDNLKTSLLRISGAIQVLEEELAKEKPPEGAAQ